jgi:DNA polymerase-3 subunit epsilon
VTRRTWPNGQVTHDDLQSLKTIAARLPSAYQNPGRFVAGRPLVQGMRVALAAEVTHTYEELIERILHAGLAYTEGVEQQTSLVICNEVEPDQGRGRHAGEMGIPLVSDADFMRLLEHVVGGASVEDFADATLNGDQFTLF